MSKILEYTLADFKKLASITKPSLGVRYTIEAVRKLIEPGFEPSNFFKLLNFLKLF
jgi:hypothetical protein